MKQKAGDSKATVFSEVTLVPHGGAPKMLADGTIMVDSKKLYIGANANWVFRWKDIENVEFQLPGSMAVTMKDGTKVMCYETDDPASFRTFHDFIEKKWSKCQSKNETPVEQPPVVTKPRRPTTSSRRRTYGKGRVLPKVTMVHPTYFSSDEEKEEAPSHSEAWRVADQLDESLSAGEDHDDDDKTTTTLHQEEEFQTKKEPKVRSRSHEKPQSMKRRLQKFQAGQLDDDIEESDDENLFGEPGLTTPAAQRVVSPADAVSHHKDQTAPPEPVSTSTKKIPPISSFFAAKSNTQKTDRCVTSPERSKIRATPTTPTRPLKRDVDWLNTPTTPRKKHGTSPYDDDAETVVETPPRSASSVSRHFPKKRTLEETDTIVGTPPMTSRRRFHQPQVRRTLSRGKFIAARRSPFVQGSPRNLADTVLNQATPKRPRLNPYRAQPTTNDDGPRCAWKGLRNLGNTCYLNSSLQMLYTVQGFASSLAGKGLDLASSIVSVADALKERGFSANPRAVKQAMDAVTDKFLGYEQRDAHEFLSDLVDQVHDELENEEKATGDEDSKATPLPTDEFFRMNVQVCLTCDSCGYTRTMEEMYRHLSLDIEDHTAAGDGDGGALTPWSIQQGINHFFKPEKRELKCEKCEHGTSATQTLRVLSRPKALLLHLKRFAMVERPTIEASGSDEKQEDGATGDAAEPKRPPPVELVFRKNKSPVEIDPKITLGPVIGEDEQDKENGTMATYDIKSVVHHIGSTAASGHYTADAIRMNESNKPEWVSFDDGSTSLTSAERVLHSDRSQRTAYMLLYTLQE